MDSLFKLFAGLVLASVLIAVTIALISVVMLVIGITMLVKRKKRIQELEAARCPDYYSGIVADSRCTPDYNEHGVSLYYYALALHYPTPDDQMHRAFLGIRTFTPLNVQNGMPVQLAAFPAPLQPPAPGAFDPARGADGMLPPQVEICTWFDKPIDETYTVMLTDDYQSALQNAERKNRIALIVGWVLIGLVMMRVIFVALYSFAKFLNLR